MIAQFNIARARWPLEDPRMGEFTSNIQRMNALAERTPGFVWRLVDDESPEAPKFPDDPRMTFTLSVWRDVESLRHFTWNTLHRRFRQRTAEWFEDLGAAYLVLWPIAENHRPDGEEALAKLAQLRAEGPSAALSGSEALVREAA